MSAALAILGILAAIAGIAALGWWINTGSVLRHAREAQRRAREELNGGPYWQPPGRKSPDDRLYQRHGFAPSAPPAGNWPRSQPKPPAGEKPR